VEHIAATFVGLVDHFGYGGLFVAMLLANIGLPIGAEIILPAAGGLTATGHLPFLWATIAVATAGELAGATIGYAIGRFGGRPLIDNYGKFVHLNHTNLDRVHGFFERHGSFAIFICRFVPVIRGIVAIPAGLAEMNLAKFYGWYFLGSLVFCGGFVLLGNELGDHLDRVMPLVHKAGFIVLAVAIVAIAVIWLVVQRRSAKSRA
jgi:membrane protein DedA with SNARE-associated domain